MKIRKTLTEFGPKITFRGKYCKGIFYSDGGSGELQASIRPYCINGDYFDDSGTHQMRVNDIKRLAEFYTNVYKELEKLDKI